jgi:hypothetical protein
MINQNISFTLLLLQLLLLGNDVAENPGPETKVGEVSVFHWNSRSIRHKTFKSPVIIIRGDDSNALSIEM